MTVPDIGVPLASPIFAVGNGITENEQFITRGQWIEWRDQLFSVAQKPVCAPRKLSWKMTPSRFKIGNFPNWDHSNFDEEDLCLHYSPPTLLFPIRHRRDELHAGLAHGKSYFQPTWLYIGVGFVFKYVNMALVAVGIKVILLSGRSHSQLKK
ncbi:hypothetical protein N7517_010977 [Penicillium concentricum]|uniref:Uncharacterized protein n=1 Tax=Penicillium concentricum TaxID=293559 RepID=A0A9W9RF51_9EURO|nr:uncharacterized protein N7517_010977 [Penicillium concentricum]KAJ5356368.1 hypothetical protein N7517_010977 [Penicillium concentricum]